MGDQPAEGMSGYLGSYLHRIDSKGRLSLPAPFRRENPDQPFVLVQVHAEALTLYPEPAWTEVEQRLRDLMRLQPDARPYVLGVTANALEVVPDSQGRVLLPERLLNGAGIGGAALVVGVIDRVELWDPERFQATVTARAPQLTHFTHQIFG